MKRLIATLAAVTIVGTAAAQPAQAPKPPQAPPIERRVEILEQKVANLERLLNPAKATAAVPAPKVHADGGDHTHTCKACGTTWGGPNHGHNCPTCGRAEFAQDAVASQGSVSSSSVTSYQRVTGSASYGAFSSCANGQCGTTQGGGYRFAPLGGRLRLR